jgi:hypothetical protein
MSMLFDRRGVIVLLAKATAISLSQRRIERSLSAKRAAAKSLLYGGTDYRNGVSVTGDRPINEGKGVGRETWPRHACEVVERARDAAGARARELGGIGENRQEHVRRMKDNTT